MYVLSLLEVRSFALLKFQYGTSASVTLTSHSVRRSQLESRLASVFYEVLVLLHNVSVSFPPSLSSARIRATINYFVIVEE